MKEKPPGAPSGFNGHTAPYLTVPGSRLVLVAGRLDTDRWPEGAGCSSLWALDARCEIPGSLDPSWEVITITAPVKPPAGWIWRAGA
jgi:hypothetical protein